MDKKPEEHQQEHRVEEADSKEILGLCPHAADPESARAEDEDGPCDDGVR
jgi:hypothetical protein